LRAIRFSFLLSLEILAGRIYGLFVKKRWVMVSAILLFALLLLGLLALDRSELYSEEFQREIVTEVSRQLHWDLKLKQVKVKILKGVDLIGINVSSKDVKPHDFLKAERLCLRYDRLEAIIHRRIVLDEFRLNAPTMEIDLSEPSLPTNFKQSASLQNSSNTVVIASSTPPSENQKPETPSGHPEKEEAISSLPALPPHHSEPNKTGAYWPAPQPMDLRKVLIDDGILSLTLPKQDKFFLNGTHIEATFSADPVPTGSGMIICQTARVPGNIQLSDSKINFLWRADTITIPKMSALTFHGDMEGSFKADQSKSDLPYDLQVAATNLNLHEIIQTLQSPNKHTQGDLLGEVQTRMRFQGSMLDPMMSSGQGIIQVSDLQLIDLPGLVLLGGLLNRPDLRNLHIDKCEMDFIFQSAKLQIPRIEILSHDLQLVGNGWINLVEKTNEFQMKLAFSDDLAKRLPSSALEGLTRRVDGFVEIPFRVWGAFENPQNDLEGRFEKLSTRAIGGAIFDKIFQSISKQPNK
jgi:hypothetical protein